MALFLSESISHSSNKEISDIDMMTSLMEAQQEMALFTESVLRADFILHEQCRTILMEAENEGEKKVKEKEKGFMSKVWEALVKVAKAVWNAVTTVYKWIKDKAIKFWNWVQEKYAQVKKWAIYKYKLVKAKGYQLYLRAILAARQKLIALSGGNLDAKEAEDKIAKVTKELADLKLKYDTAAESTATEEVSTEELRKIQTETEKIAETLPKLAEEAVKETEEQSRSNGRSPTNGIWKTVINLVSDAGHVAASIFSTITGAKPVVETKPESK
jgi:hypothetical protein